MFDIIVRKKLYYLKHKTEILAKITAKRAANRDAYNQYMREYNKKYPHLRKAYYQRTKDKHKNRKLLERYSITEEDFNRLVASHEGKCAICNLEVKLCVDHDHTTNKIRGLLCGTCNAGLGMFKDNQKLLAKAVEYLQ